MISSPRFSPSLRPLLGLAIALVVGGWFRLWPALTHDWAVGDGGLFFSMARQIERNGWALPATLDYNAPLDLPMAYPPLGFYFAALTARLGASLEAYFRFAPAWWSIASIVAFWLVARQILASPRAVALATIAFAVLPWSGLWNVMGGGVARAPGYFFALMSVFFALRLWKNSEEEAPNSGTCVLFRSRQPRLEEHASAATPRELKANNTFQAQTLSGAAIFLALALATHLERAHFAVFSLVLVWLVFGRTRRSFVQLGAIGMGGLMLSAPYWALVWARFGIAPFLAASHSAGRDWPARPPISQFSGEPFFPILGVLALIGLGLALKRRQFFAPLWCVLILVVEPRSPWVFLAIPLALGLGLALEKLWPQGDSRVNLGKTAILCGLAVWSVLVASTFAQINTAISPGERAAMAWAKTNTPDESRFVVLPMAPWDSDLTAEWFPALARRASLSTVQGTEWLPNGEFGRRWRRHEALRQTKTPDDLRVWMPFDYLFVPRHTSKYQPSWSALEAQLRQSPRYEMVFQNSDATIFRRRREVIV